MIFLSTLTPHTAWVHMHFIFLFRKYAQRNRGLITKASYKAGKLDKGYNSSAGTYNSKTDAVDGSRAELTKNEQTLII